MKLLFLSLISYLLTITIYSQPPKVKDKPPVFKNWGSKKHPVEIQLQNIETFFSYIPMQAFRQNDGRLVSVQSFYMMKIEVPNLLYQMFINDLELQGNSEKLNEALPDTTIWGEHLPFVNYYFRHPAYNTYPVIGVSKKGINLFCEWMTEKSKSIKFFDFWKGKNVIFRLPYEIEWMVAASGGDTSAIYPWRGIEMQNWEKPYVGDYLANFKNIRNCDIIRNQNNQFVVENNQNSQYASSLNDNDFTFTSPSLSYWPNAYGIYNMSGNVREIIQEDGYTKGGGYLDPGGELMIRFRNTYLHQQAPCEGFRLVAVLKQ